jgi:hypothetical protein
MNSRSDNSMSSIIICPEPVYDSKKKKKMILLLLISGLVHLSVLSALFFIVKSNTMKSKEDIIITSSVIDVSKEVYSEIKDDEVESFNDRTESLSEFSESSAKSKISNGIIENGLFAIKKNSDELDSKFVERSNDLWGNSGNEDVIDNSSGKPDDVEKLKLLLGGKQYQKVESSFEHGMHQAFNLMCLVLSVLKKVQNAELKAPVAYVERQKTETDGGEKKNTYCSIDYNIFYSSSK